MSAFNIDWLREREIWFAWYPVRLADGRLRFWCFVERERDFTGHGIKSASPGPWEYLPLSRGPEGKAP